MLDNRGGTSAIKRLYSNLTAGYRCTDLSFAIADYVSLIVSLCECRRPGDDRKGCYGGPVVTKQPLPGPSAHCGPTPGCRALWPQAFPATLTSPNAGLIVTAAMVAITRATVKTKSNLLTISFTSFPFSSRLHQKKNRPPQGPSTGRSS